MMLEELLDNGKYSSHAQLYSFTTENLAGYMPQMDMAGKDILAITASGDHLINAYMLGAKDVDCFDINQYAALYSELKVSAIKELDYEAFKSFFLRSPEAFDEDIYRTLDIGERCRQLFDRCYEVAGNGYAIRESALFNNSYDDNYLKIRSNPYLLNESAYKKAKERIRVPGFITSDVKDLAQVAGNYDIIMLSNIGDNASAMSPGDRYLAHYRDQVVEPLKGRLNEDGIICISYIYDMGTNQYRSDIDNPAKRNKIFPDTFEMRFTSVIDGKYDMIIGGKR